MHTSIQNRNKKMHLIGLEPTTPGFGSRCSIQLSYRCMVKCLFLKPLIIITHFTAFVKDKFYTNEFSRTQNFPVKCTGK